MNSQNRSTLYQYLQYETPLVLKYLKRGRGSYKVYAIPEDWEHSYLMVNNVRIKDFQALIIFTNELVVRFGVTLDAQINIPYREIDKIEVMDGMMIPYEGIYLNKDK